ncbi:MAG: UvrD-helicase domain-containing protein [Ignavibacteriales bacterium]|nr:UvrD-helicase domain-containing protein [Ignavibacteriales bacterium]
MPSFTPSQLAAIDFQSPSSVTANAGTGKTLVLIHRFLNILLETNTNIREIVAVTFTDKAASELRKKNSLLLEEKIRDAKGDLYKKLTSLRTNLASAHIETIHSFCSRLLREFPIEADVDAGFTIIESVDQSRLFEEAMMRTFQYLLNEPTALLHSETTNLVRTLGKKKIQEVLRFLLHKREQVERLGERNLFHQTENEIVEFWNETIHRELTHHIMEKEWQTAVEIILFNAKGKTVGETLNHFRAFQLSPSIEQYQLLCKAILTDKNTLRKTFIGKIDETSLERERIIFSNHRYQIESLLKIFPEEKTKEGQHRLAKISKPLFKLNALVQYEYEHRKDEFGYLDFDDLMLKTKQLLKNPAIQQRLSERFKYIMVDEYQDTNRVQYEILKPLIQNSAKGNLYIVGDPKQSIYGFRKAEVEVFEETKKDVGNTKELLESFRPLANIVAFVNKVFSTVMIPPESDIQYEPLTRGRQNNAEGDVELLLAMKNDEPETIATPSTIFPPQLSEEELIARKILELVQSEQTVFSKEEIAEKVAFKHFGILLRSRTKLKMLEAVLNSYRIPFVVSSGIGFYQTQELNDFSNYFQFLLNQNNDVALAGILRSPFFHLSDAELYAIATQNSDKDTFWEKLLAFSQEKNCSEKIRDTTTILLDTISVAHRYPLPFLLQKILDDTGLTGVVAGLPNGEQILANIEKLRRLARAYQGLGYITLFDFTQRLKRLMDDVEREGQETIAHNSDAVQIMTIHAAKGLEFPIVVLPYCNKEFNTEKEPFFDEELGIGISWNDVEGNKVQTPILEFLRKKKNRKSVAEEMRVFYVACTRTRDRLILSATINTHKALPQSYMAWVMESLNLDIPSLSSEREFQSPEKISVLEKNESRFVKSAINHQLRINIIRNIPLTPRGDGDTPLRNNLSRPVFLEPIIPTSKGNFFSATQIQTYHECPAKYYLRFVLGVPEIRKTRRLFAVDDERDGNPFGGIIGKLTHSILQEIVHPISEQEITSIVAQKFSTEETLDDDVRTKIFADVEKNVASFVNSDFGKQVLLSKEQETEKTLNASIGEDYFTGTIDRLYRDEQGNVCILDYKTTRISVEYITQAALNLQWQIKSYALLLKKFFFKQREFPVTIFFTHHPLLPQQFCFSSDEITLFENEVMEIISRINRRAFERSEKTCEHCPYEQNGNCIIE